MRIVEPAGLAEFKQRARASWAAGDFAAVAQRNLWEVGERLVHRVGVGADEDVLDVACGTGNVAIRAAQAGGRVIGVDLTPELFAAGRELADQAGVRIDWTEGDAEALPFGDDSFDVVLSTFGVMYAPRHDVAASELVRVLRPGGRLGLCNWTTEGIQGSLFRALGGFLPSAPPTFAQPPLAWGTEDHVRRLFAGTGMELEFDRDAVDGTPFVNGTEAVDFMAQNFGPMMMLRGPLEAAGTWTDFRHELADVYDRREPGEYLMVLGRKS